MKINRGYFAPTLGLAAAVAAIAAAPIAAASPTAPPAAPTQSCTSTGSGTLCQSPGNAQINDAPPPVQFYPYGGEAFLL